MLRKAPTIKDLKGTTIVSLVVFGVLLFVFSLLLGGLGIVEEMTLFVGLVLNVTSSYIS